MEDLFVLRLEKFISQSELSIRKVEKKAGISKGLLARVIRNKTSISSDNLEKLAKAFPHLDMNWLLAGRVPKQEMSLSEKEQLKLMLDESINEALQRRENLAILVQQAQELKLGYQE